MSNRCRSSRSTPTRPSIPSRSAGVHHYASYQFVDRAVYSWKLEETGKIISTEPQLTYRFDSGNEISEGVNGYYIDLEVTTPNGTTVETVLVEVQELLPP